MKTVLRTSLGALTIGLCGTGAVLVSSAPASAGACLSSSRSIASLIDPGRACAPTDPAWTGRTAVKPPMPQSIAVGAVTQPAPPIFARMLLAPVAQMSDFRVSYSIHPETPLATQAGASVRQPDGVTALVSAPSMLGHAFMIDLGLLVPESAASGTNPWVTADVGGVNTLIRPKESVWRRPNDNTLFSDLFGEPAGDEDDKGAKRP